MLQVLAEALLMSSHKICFHEEIKYLWILLLSGVRHIQKQTLPPGDHGPVVQSVVSLTSSLRVISLTVLADSIHNILIFFAEKM